MAVFREIARTGFVALRLHPLRALVTVGALVAVLLPYLACLGISRGLQEQAQTSINLGADIYLSARAFGRPAPLPLAALDRIRGLPGVADAAPRIVGSIVLGSEEEHAVLVGLPQDRFPASLGSVEGRLPQGPNELVMGAALAGRLHVKVGSVIPPFYHSAQGERVSRVVGVFGADADVWQANLVFTSLETAAHIFNQTDAATDMLIWCKPGYQAQVAAALVTLELAAAGPAQNLRPHILTREEAAALLLGGVARREGIVQLHFVLAFSVGILVVLVTSGFGLSGRRREIGILKATGWQTDQILLRSAVESLLLALTGIAVAVVLAWVWLRWLNGLGIAAIFLTGLDAAPGIRVPFRLTPVPVLLAFLIGLVVVLTGTLYSSWRAATAPPMEAMR